MMKKILFTILLLGFVFAQDAHYGRIDGQVKMQNEVIDLLSVDGGEHYMLQGSFTLGTANDTSLVVFDNGSGNVRLKWDIGGLVATTILVQEGGASIDSTIINLSLINQDRNSSETTGIDSVYSVPEDSTGISRYGGTTISNVSIGALQNITGDIMMLADSLTTFKITTDANSNKVYYSFELIEY